MSTKREIAAALESHRTTVLLAKVNPATTEFVPDAYAFAMDNRLFPGFDRTEDAFEEGYLISKNTFEEVIRYCSDAWSSGEALSFYDVEGSFGRDMRWEIIVILRYASLKRRFDEKFFLDIARNCPTEAHGISDPFRLDELSLV